MGRVVDDELGDDPDGHVKKAMWKVRGNQLVLEGANTGELGQCQAVGTMALLVPISPFFTDNVYAEFDLLVAQPSSSVADTGVGFVFRYQSASFYRFEWQNACMSIVRYRAGKRRPVGTVLASRTDAPITYDRWYKVWLSASAAVVHVDVRATKKGVASKATQAEWRDEHYWLDSANDTEYVPFAEHVIGGFFGVRGTTLQVDNVVIVARDDKPYLSSWDDKPYPDGAVCATLPETSCFRETFFRRGTALTSGELPNAVFADGPAGSSANWRLWPAKELADGNGNDVDGGDRALVELSGHSATVASTNRAPCQRLYGTYFQLNDTEKVQADEFIVSFRMKAVDKHTRGIGLMLRLQSAVPGHQPLPSYYRYSWGRTEGGDENCDGVMYHNGKKARFEDVMSEPSEQSAPVALVRGVWHRIEVHVSRDRVEVTRDGELVGQPIFKLPGAPSLPLTWGGMALYCGGSESAAGDAPVCAFDDVLLVDKEAAREALVWDGKSHVPAERPASRAPLVDTGDLPVMRWEGVRTWSMFYAQAAPGQPLVPTCAPRGESYNQSMAIEFFANGHFRVLAHTVTLAPDARTGAARYLPAEQRDAFVVRDYDKKMPNAELIYKRSPSDDEHCMQFVVSDGRQRASLIWAKDDARCPRAGAAAAASSCGFSADLFPLGDVSQLYPPSVVVTDPLPNHVELWTVGANQTVTLRVYNAHSLRNMMQVRLQSLEVQGSPGQRINEQVDFSRDNTDQWITGEARMKTTIAIDKSFLLGRNAISFQLRNAPASALVSVDVSIVCPVCQVGQPGREGSTCAFSCTEPHGCVEPRCDIGKIRCTRQYTGVDADGICTKWALDRSPVCRPNGGCSGLDELNFCDWPGNSKKAVTRLQCGSPVCRRACDAGTEAPDWTYFDHLDYTLVCHTNGTTPGCTYPAQCRDEGFCLSKTAAPTPQPRITPAPPNAPTAPPTPKPTPLPPVVYAVETNAKCRTNCGNSWGEVGSDNWCKCCRDNCNQKLDWCKSVNGFCTTRCVDEDGTFCPRLALPPPAPTVDFEPVGTRPPTPDWMPSPRPQEESEESSEESGESEESSESSSEETTTRKKTTTTTVTSTTTVQQLTAEGATTIVSEANSHASLVVGALALTIVIGVVVWYRKRSQQKPIDLAHVA